jgi:hypothetical protein
MTDTALPRLYERDIDVLLQEELALNTPVVQLFAEALGLPGTPDVTGCRLSVHDGSGETDVHATIALGASRGVLLIENKIDAAFQPRQAERYRDRAAALAAQDSLDMAYCALVAPRPYVRGEGDDLAHFDAIVTGEDVADAIEREGTARARHRAALLRRAVEQARSSYTLVPAAEVTSLWHRIHRIASTEFPALGMKRPKDKGSNSHWVIFKADLPAWITIDWKITKATVDLSFWKGAMHLPRTTIDLAPLRARTSAGASLKLLGETQAISVPVSAPPSPFSDIDEAGIREGLRTALALYDFYREQPEGFA